MRERITRSDGDRDDRIYLDRGIMTASKPCLWMLKSAAMPARGDSSCLLHLPWGCCLNVMEMTPSARVYVRLRRATIKSSRCTRWTGSRYSRSSQQALNSCFS